MGDMDPRKSTNYSLEKIKCLREQIKTAMNTVQNSIERALGISSESNPGGAPVSANSGIVTGRSSSANLASNSIVGPSTTSSVRKRARSPEDQTSIKKRHRTDTDDKTSSIKLKNMVPSISQQNYSSQAQKRKYKKTKKHTLDKQSISRQREIQAAKVFQDAIAKALGISTASSTSGTGTQIASTSVPYTSLVGNLQATPSTSSIQSISGASTSVTTSQTSVSPTTTIAKATKTISSTKYQVMKTCLEKRKHLREQINTAMNTFQNAIERAIGFSSESSQGGAPVGANSGIVTGKSSSANLASNSTAGPSTTSSVRKRACSPEDQTSSKKRHRTDKDDKTSSIKLKTMVPSTSQQNDSSYAQKRKYKKTKRRTPDKQSILRQKEKQAAKVFQDAIAKALGISTTTGTGTGTQIASTSVSYTKTMVPSTSQQNYSSYAQKRKYKKTKRRTPDKQNILRQKEKQAAKVFQDAIAKALGISTTTGTGTGTQIASTSVSYTSLASNLVAAPIRMGANTSVITSQASVPPTTTVAKAPMTIPSTSSLVMKNDRFDQQNNNTGNRNTSQSSLYSQPKAYAYKIFQDAIAKVLGISSGGVNTSVVTSQTPVPPLTTVAKDTSTISSTSSLVMNKDGFKQQNTGTIFGISATDTRIVPNISSASTRGIHEYIALSDMERAINAHQRQMAQQQQMEHLRMSPFSIYEDSPLFRNPIPETRKRKFDTSPEAVALWNPKRFRLRLGKGPRVHPKALERKPEAQQKQGKEDCTTDDIFPPREVLMARLRQRAPSMKIKDMLKMIRSEQSEKKDDSPKN